MTDRHRNPKSRDPLPPDHVIVGWSLSKLSEFGYTFENTINNENIFESLNFKIDFKTNQGFWRGNYETDLHRVGIHCSTFSNCSKQTIANSLNVTR